MKLLHAIILGSGVLMSLSPLAVGDGQRDIYRSKVSGDWNAATTWEIGDAGGRWRDLMPDDAIPRTADHATIQAGHDVVVSGQEEIGKLRIERGTEYLAPGTLDIKAGARLIIHRGLGMARRPKEAPSARIVFSGAGETPGVLHSMTVLDIYGDVEVVGPAGGVISTEHPTDLVCVSRHADLSATGGPLSMGGTVEMDGTVIADGPHTVAVKGDLIREGSSGTWKVAHPDATIVFETAKDVFLRSGKIVIEKGTFDAATNVKLARSVSQADGARINVRGGASLEVAGRLIRPEQPGNALGENPPRSRMNGDANGK